MRPSRFPQQTTELQRPAGMTEKECGVLAVHQTGVHCISRWVPTWRERLEILFGRPVWLWVWSGQTQPPVALSTESPFVPREPTSDASVRVRRAVAWLFR
jgi:hypothetical protein